MGVCFLALCIWMLWPGLHGGFYLDDFPNLSPLENVGKNDTPLFSYLLNPAVSGLGRPFSYLTFLLQHDSWPNDPFNFKLLNLGIHVVNGVLVFFITVLALHLGSGRRFSRSTIYAVAVGCSFIWMILPIHSSAIFYVIQRMTLLSALFTLSGVLGYLWIRLKYKTWGTKQYFWAVFFICFGYVGVLAKENAIQTGLLIWAFELTVLSRLSWRPSIWFQCLFFLAPIFLLFLYLFTVNDVLAGYGHRDFTLKERLLTQSVIIWEYISKILFPTPSRLHLFNDGGPIYNRIFSDPVVLFSLLGLLLSSIFAFLTRRKSPWLALAILFFYFGHVLESTFIPLEMNFEHRNYLPSVGLMIGISVSLILVFNLFQLDGFVRKSAIGFVLIWVIFVSSVSMLEARTWGSSKSFALSSLVDRPDSYRARQEAAAFFIANGEYLTAANLLYSIDVDFDVYAGTYAQLLLLKCYDDSIPLPSESEIKKIFEAAPNDLGVEMALHDIWRIKRESADLCTHIKWSQFLDYIEALIRNDNFSGSLNLKLLASFINADSKDYDAAIDILESLPESQKNIAVRIMVIRFNAMAQKHDKAIKLINQILRDGSEVNKLVYSDYLRSLKDRISENVD